MNKCAQCSKEGFRFRGERWLCEVHNRIDTMRNCARAKGKVVPTNQQLEALFEVLISNGMVCPHCKKPVIIAGKKKGQPDVISLQHDRDGTIRLICMLCNQRHDDLPGDLFYQIPLDHKRCPNCKETKPLTEFWIKGNGSPYSSCKTCKKSAWVSRYERIKQS